MLRGANIGKRLGITELSVLNRRKKLGVQSRWRRILQSSWGLAELGLVGQYPDEEVAKLLKRPVEDVRRKRIEIGRIQPQRC